MPRVTGDGGDAKPARGAFCHAEELLDQGAESCVVETLALLETLEHLVVRLADDMCRK